MVYSGLKAAKKGLLDLIAAFRTKESDGGVGSKRPCNDSEPDAKRARQGASPSTFNDMLSSPRDRGHPQYPQNSIQPVRLSKVWQINWDRGANLK